MVARELRIGNFVSIGGKTVYMDARLFHAVIHGFPGYEPEAIPLTSELVISLGFKLSCGSYWCNDISISQTDEGGKFVLDVDGRYFGEPFEYLHELQNLYYALKKEELTIKELSK